MEVKSILFNLFLLVIISIQVDCRIGSGFIKDQRTDFVDFPPKVYKKYDSPVPVGHLRPLGKFITRTRESHSRTYEGEIEVSFTVKLCTISKYK